MKVIYSIFAILVIPFLLVYYSPEINKFKEGELIIHQKISKNFIIPENELFITEFIITNSTNKKIFSKDFKYIPCVKILNKNVEILDLNTIEKNNNLLSIINKKDSFCFEKLNIESNSEIIFNIYSTNKIESDYIYFDANLIHHKFEIEDAINYINNQSKQYIIILILLISILLILVLFISKKLQTKKNELNTSILIINRKDNDINELKKQYENISEQREIEEQDHEKKIDELNSELSIYKQISNEIVEVKKKFIEYSALYEEFKKNRR